MPRIAPKEVRKATTLSVYRELSNTKRIKQDGAANKRHSKLLQREDKDWIKLCQTKNLNQENVKEYY